MCRKWEPWEPIGVVCIPFVSAQDSGRSASTETFMAGSRKELRGRTTTAVGRRVHSQPLLLNKGLL